MTTLSKHQLGAGQGVEFQSRQSHTGTKGAGGFEKLFIPLLTCSHMKTHIILWEMRNVILACVSRWNNVLLRLPNPIRCEFVKCYRCFTSSLYKHCFKSYPTFKWQWAERQSGWRVTCYTDPIFISPALCFWSVVLKHLKTWFRMITRVCLWTFVPKWAEINVL